jgi:hypothetical protein
MGTHSLLSTEHQAVHHHGCSSERGPAPRPIINTASLPLIASAPALLTSRNLSQHRRFSLTRAFSNVVQSQTRLCAASSPAHRCRQSRCLIVRTTAPHPSSPYCFRRRRSFTSLPLLFTVATPITGAVRFESSRRYQISRRLKPGRSSLPPP